MTSFFFSASPSAAISLFLLSVGLRPSPAVAILGLVVTFLGLSCSVGYLWLGQRMLGQEQAEKLHRALVLAVLVGLIARAIYESLPEPDRPPPVTATPE